MTQDITTRPQREKLARPSSKWRNKWQVLERFHSIESGLIREVGEIYWGRKVHPTQDIAETFAARCIADPTYGRCGYLGAHEVPE